LQVYDNDQEVPTRRLTQTAEEHRAARDAYLEALKYHKYIESLCEATQRLAPFGEEWLKLDQQMDILYGQAGHAMVDKRRVFCRPILSEWFFDPQFAKLKQVPWTVFFELPDLAQVCLARKIDAEGVVKETVFLMQRTDWYRTIHYPDFDEQEGKALWKSCTLDPADWDPTNPDSAFAVRRGRNILFFVAPLDACFSPRLERTVPAHLACFSGMQSFFTLARPSKALREELIAASAISDETEREAAMAKLPAVERHCYVCEGSRSPHPYDALVYYRACGHQVGCLGCAEVFFTNPQMRLMPSSHLCGTCRVPFPGDCRRIFKALKKGALQARTSEQSARRKHSRQSLRATGSPFYPLDLSFGQALGLTPEDVLAPDGGAASGFAALKALMLRFARSEPRLLTLVMSFLLSFGGEDDSEDEQLAMEAPPSSPLVGYQPTVVGVPLVDPNGGPPLTQLWSGVPPSALELSADGPRPWPAAAVSALEAEMGEMWEEEEVPGTPPTEVEEEEKEAETMHLDE
jgi:hypothetical protein